MSRRFLNRDVSFFDLCLYARQFQSRDNFPSPAKTVRHASLCRRLDNRVSSSFLKRDVSSFDIVHWMLQFYARVVVELELRYVYYTYLYIEKSLPLSWLAPARQLYNIMQSPGELKVLLSILCAAEVCLALRCENIHAITL